MADEFDTTVDSVAAPEPDAPWESMIDDSEPVAAPVDVPSEAAPPPVEAPKVEELKPVPETKPAAEPSVPVEPVKSQEPVRAPEPQEPPPTPVDYAALRASELERLSQAYALPADQATALLTEPETVLPKLAAKLHQDIMANVLAVMQANLPQAIETVTASKTRESEAKQEFYSAWPGLKGYEQQVLAAGAMFRQINPTAPKEQAIQAIGQLAMQALGLQPSTPIVAEPAPQQTSVPFTPAGGRTGGGAPAVKPTIWDDMTADSW